jgi:tetratricopeptide (TPR) repeat protein
MKPDVAVCDAIRERDLVGRYIAGKLSESEASEFESHYLTCERCQQEVRLGAAIAAAPVVTEHPSFLKRAAFPFAIAAGLGALTFIALSRETGLRGLGNVTQAPPYQGMQIRGAGTGVNRTFNAAMNAYGERRYRDVIGGLDSVLRAGADSAPAEFFRASALMMLSRNDEAAEGFRRTVALGETNYLPESHYYRAKVLIRMGRSREAVIELTSVDRAHPDIYRMSSALADSLRAASR